MTVTGVGGAGPLQFAKSYSKEDSPSDTFGQFLDSSSSSSSTPAFSADDSSSALLSSKTQATLFDLSAASANSAPPTASGKTATQVDGVTTITAPDGTVWTRYEVDKLLSPHDKIVLGYPVSPDDHVAGFIVGMVVSDRADGSLKGAINADYILGNKEKGIAGIADRFLPGYVTPGRISELLSRFHLA